MHVPINLLLHGKVLHGTLLCYKWDRGSEKGLSISYFNAMMMSSEKFFVQSPITSTLTKQLGPKPHFQFVLEPSWVFKVRYSN